MKRPTPSAYDIELARVRRVQNQAADAYDRAHGEDICAVEPCRIPEQLRISARLGSASASSDAKVGAEDEYANHMRARYDGEY